MTPTEIQNHINIFLVAKYYEILKEHPEKYARKRYYYKKSCQADHYIALGVAHALIESEV
ncbi:hypothetical protein [Vibrio cholerae]|uniref:Uncharacterized protein n=1 Tax=Vibrio cholerae serotype O1 biovar El Tor TaxID=686 RepID=M1SVG0_VIBCE|nr:hypothetical protein [Vibrio cholerae]AGG36641.1 hypothetical protein [Vibrio cholerae O1 biovar El Tor]ASA40214.1 hypothetical protein [Vibrio cholerae O1 biovar El Tor]EJL6542611.1 hypothetical protein [Vibrio cholerae]KWW49603.1 hypothetical protein AVW04_13705 [Vibrio cholerae O1 biovar El Tor]CSA98028.1 Uncharacterised protein [Vibrio cholerae]